MRVVILSPAAELGGAERSLLTFLKAAQGTLVEAMVLLPREGPLAAALTRINVPWEVAPMPPEFMSLSRNRGALSAARLLKALPPGLRYAAGLRRRINHLAPEVIYTNGIKGHVLAALLAPWVKGRVVWHLRDFWPGRYAGFLADRGPARHYRQFPGGGPGLSETPAASRQDNCGTQCRGPRRIFPGRAPAAPRSLEQICPAGRFGSGLCPVERSLPVF